MDLMTTLGDIQRAFSGEFSLYAEHLATGETIAFGDVDKPMETASVMKLPVLVEALRQCQQGRHRLDEPISYQPDDDVEGSGLLQSLTQVPPLPLNDLLTLMIIVSDNLATNMVLRTVGIGAVNALCRELQMDHTAVKRKLDSGYPGPLALSTCRDLVRLLKVIKDDGVLDRAYGEVARDMLSQQQYQVLLTRYLPSDLLEGQGEDPPKVKILSKSGAVNGIRNDVGLVLTPWGDYAVALLSAGSKDLRFHVDTEAEVLLPHATRAVFDHFFPGKAGN